MAEVDPTRATLLGELVFMPASDGEGFMSLKIERRAHGAVIGERHFVGAEAQDIYSQAVRLSRLHPDPSPIKSEPADRGIYRGLNHPTAQNAQE